MSGRIIAVLLTPLLIISCAISGQKNEPAPVVIDSACDWVQPIYVTCNDITVIDPRTKKAILDHNESWQAVCKKESS